MSVGDGSCRGGLAHCWRPFFDHGAGSGVLGHAEDVAGQDAEDQGGDGGEGEADGGGDAGGRAGIESMELASCAGLE